MQVSQMWRQFSLADLRDLPGDPEVRSHYKRDGARWLPVIQTFRGNTEVDKPRQFQTHIRENKRECGHACYPNRMQKLHQKASAFHSWSWQPTRVLLQKRMQPEGILLLLSLSAVVLALGCLLMRTSYCPSFHIQKIMWGQPARFILGSIYGSPTDILLALAYMSHVWPQPISTISKALFMTFLI